MPALQDMANLGPEDMAIDPVSVQQLISRFNGYPGSGGPATFLNDDDLEMLIVDHDGSITGAAGVYATPDDGSTYPERITTDSNGGSFVGMIVMTDADPNDLAIVWWFCDGTNGTPDLRNRFVLGRAVDTDPDSSGGTGGTLNLQHSHSHSHSAGTLLGPLHSHGATGLSGPSHVHTGPNHQHGITGLGVGGSTGIADSTGGTGGTTGGPLPDGTHKHSNGTLQLTGSIDFAGTGNTGAAGTGSVTGSTANDGNGSATGSTATDATNAGSTTADIMPPYYTLAYVKRVS
jgi:hypothetical protein